MSPAKESGNDLQQLVITSTTHGYPLTKTSGANQPPELDTASRRPIVEDANSLAITVTNLLKDVAKTAGNLPYVEGIAGIVAQLLQIQQELQTQSKRCNELLEKVLRRGKVVFEQWKSLKAHRQDGRFQELLGQLEDYHSLLQEVYTVLQRMAGRKFLRRLFDRGLDDLNELDRRIDSFGVDIILRGVTQTLGDMSVSRKSDKNVTETSTTDLAEFLPLGPVCMLERDSQQETVVRSLLATSNAKVAILGMGGIGKTTLACSAMRDPLVVEAYSRRLFISFEGLTTSELAFNSLATTFSIPADSRKSDSQVLKEVLRHLRQEKTLICLDNFETFWEVPANRRAADDFLGKLSSLPDLAIIVTLRGTQEPGNVRWLRVGPLEPLSQAASKDLVLEITRGQVDDSGESSLQNLLDAVAGIPLAVTLVGNLLRDESETPQSLWHRWCKESTRAIGMEVPDRQYRLDISLKVSIFGSRMTDNARDILVAISVLPAGLSSDDGWLDEFQTLIPYTINVRDCLRALRHAALSSLDKGSIPPRYQLLSPVRQFCLQTLPLDVTVIHKLIDLYGKRLGKSARYNSSTQYAWVTNELTNITAVLSLAFSIQYLPDAIIHACSSYTNWIDYLGSPETTIIQKAIDSQIKPSSAKGKCLRSLADLLSGQNKLQEAADLLIQASVVHKEVGDIRQEAHDYSRLGRVYRLLGNLEQAEISYNDALSLHQQEEFAQGQAHCLHGLSVIYNDTRQFPKAETAATEAIKLYRSANDLLGEANTLNTLGATYNMEEKLGLALTTLENAWRISVDVKNSHGQAVAKRSIGMIHMKMGHMDKAVSSLQEAVELYERASSVSGARSARESLEQLLSLLDRSA